MSHRSLHLCSDEDMIGNEVLMNQRQLWIGLFILLLGCRAAPVVQTHAALLVPEGEPASLLVQHPFGVAKRALALAFVSERKLLVAKSVGRSVRPLRLDRDGTVLPVAELKGHTPPSLCSGVQPGPSVREIRCASAGT